MNEVWYSWFPNNFKYFKHENCSCLTKKFWHVEGFIQNHTNYDRNNARSLDCDVISGKSFKDFKLQEEMTYRKILMGFSQKTNVGT